LLPILAIGVSASTARVSLADQPPSVPLPVGMVEELVPLEFIFEGTKIASGPEGTVWFSEYGANGLTIARMSPTDLINGEFVVPALRGIVTQEAYMLLGLARGSGGDMWFTANVENHSFVGRVTSAGRFSEFLIPGESYALRGVGIAQGAKGDMWFTNRGEGKIGLVDETGAISQYPIPTGVLPGSPESSEPWAIALGADGDMWFTDDGSNKEGQNFIGRISPTGAISEFATPAHSDPGGIALGADGNMWFTEPGVRRIGRITPGGTISEFTVPYTSGLITLGPDENIWFMEAENAIGRITPTGEVTSFAPISPDGSNPEELAAGFNGDLWFAASHLDRFTVPFAPVNAGLPVVSGEAMEGRTLSVSEGSWLHNPSAIGYQWQVCDAFGRSCGDLAGEVEATHVLTTGDVGHTLRAVVSASDIGGSASAVSAVSGVVGVPPSVLPPAKPPVLKQVPLPVVGATMTWNFGWSRAYTIIEALVVHGLPAGGLVEVLCEGGGCAFAHHHWATAAHSRSCRGRKCMLRRPVVLRGSANLAGLFKHRHLKVGARVVVTVDKAGWIGKSFVFTMRANRPPRVQITCLGSGAGNPAGEC
jgi:streptogramin lyase